MTKTAAVTEQREILGGKALILRTAASGTVWQFRMWISEERKYVRKTLNTRDLKTAVQRGEELYLQIYSDLKSGKRLFGITLAALVDDYLESRKNDVVAGTITKGRLVTLSSQLKHLLAYKGATTKLSELDRNALFDYGQHRRLTDGARSETIKNEQSTINHLMRFAYRRGHAHFDGFEFAPLKIKEVSRRDTFTLEEYDELVRYLRTYASKAQCADETTRLERLLIRDCILIASNTMLRVGELWQLRWGDVLSYEQRADDAGRVVLLVTLKVRGETAKTRRSRVITTRGGEYFKRLYERTKFREKSDLVFCTEAGDKRLRKRTLYGAWDELMQGIGLDYKTRNVTWYSLRHFGITCRLRAGASIFDISKIAGNSVSDIERNYGHFDQDMAIAAALKNFRVRADGIEEVKVER